MKKVLLSIIAIFTFGFMSAQKRLASLDYKPTKGTVTTEVGLTGGLNNANFNLSTLKFRYFLKENIGLRMGLGIQNETDEDINNANPSNTITTTDKNSRFQINLGVEKHFEGSDRLSTFVGGDLVISLANQSNEVVQQNGNFNKSRGGGNAGSAFGVQLLTGADYYIAKKVYLGVEAGLSILTGKGKDVITETRTIVSNVVTNTSSTSTGGKSFDINTQVFGGVRIGYQF